MGRAEEVAEKSLNTAIGQKKKLVANVQNKHYYTECRNFLQHFFSVDKRQTFRSLYNALKNQHHRIRETFGANINKLCCCQRKKGLL